MKFCSFVALFDPMLFHPLSFDPMAFDPRSVNQKDHLSITLSHLSSSAQDGLFIFAGPSMYLYYINHLSIYVRAYIYNKPSIYLSIYIIHVSILNHPHKFSLLINSLINILVRVDFEVSLRLGLRFYRSNSIILFCSLLHVHLTL